MDYFDPCRWMPEERMDVWLTCRIVVLAWIKLLVLVLFEST